MSEKIYMNDTKESENTVKLPKNIRQIGNPSVNIKIYMEDYVSAFIKKPPVEKDKRGYGVLLGEIKEDSNCKYIFISGVVCAEAADNKFVFDENVWATTYNRRKEFFDRLEVVGWYATLAYRTKEDLPNIKKAHLDNFAGNDKVCFLVDRSEHEEGFYVYNAGNMIKQSGYYVYYERNEMMQKYLLYRKRENEASKEKIESLKSGTEKSELHKLENKINESTEKNKLKNIEKNNSINNEKNKEKNKDRNKGKNKELTLNKIINRSVQKENLEKETQENNWYTKYVMKTSAALSSLLIVALLVSTIVMMNNYGELKKIKESINDIAVSNSSSDNYVEAAWSGIKDSEQITEENTKDDGDIAQETDIEDVDSEVIENSSDNQETEGEDEVLYGEIVSQAENTDSNQSNGEESASDTIDVASKGYSTHVVKSGETVYEISIEEYGDASMADGIKELNNLDDNYSIVEGEELLLP